MKIQVNVELTGQEILNLFIQEAKKSNLDLDTNKIKILFKNKDGKDVELSHDRLSIVYNQ